MNIPIETEDTEVYNFIMKKRLISVAITLPLFTVIMFYDKVIYLFHLLILSILSISSIAQY